MAILAIAPFPARGRSDIPNTSNGGWPVPERKEPKSCANRKTKLKITMTYRHLRRVNDL
jgi:hypothetical protein